jgi:hypothetical protein
MRDYGKVAASFWTGETGRALRGHMESQIVACYLMTAPGSNMIGLYHLPIPLIAHHTGMTFKGALKGLQRGCEVGFCLYDYDREEVYVPEMARYQIGESLSSGDKRKTGVIRELQLFRKSQFFNEFYRKYKDVYDLPELAIINCDTEAPSKPLQRGYVPVPVPVPASVPKKEASAEEQIPPELDNIVFRRVWQEWQRHRCEMKKPLTKETTRKQLKKLAAMGEIRAVAALEFSITNGWQGIFEPKEESRGQNNGMGSRSHQSDREPDRFKRLTKTLSSADGKTKGADQPDAPAAD